MTGTLFLDQNEVDSVWWNQGKPRMLTVLISGIFINKCAVALAKITNKIKKALFVNRVSFYEAQLKKTPSNSIFL